MSNANPMKSYRRYRGSHSRQRGSGLVKAVLTLILIAVIVFCVLLGVVVAGSRDEINGDPQVMLVLGCQVLPSGEPSPLLKNRLDEAIAYLESNADMKVIVSGGKGTNELISEAQAMKNYLVDCGIADDRIRMEDRATSTYENFIFGIGLLEEESYDLSNGVLVVSNGFHLARARMLWSRITGDEEAISTLAAPCGHFGSMLWMHIREPLVFAKDFLLRR